MKSPSRNLIRGSAVSLAMVAGAFWLLGPSGPDFSGPDFSGPDATRAGSPDEAMGRSHPAERLDLAAETVSASAVATHESPKAEETIAGSVVESTGHGRGEHERSTSEEQTPLVTWLNENPLSTSPHEVVRAWGDRPRGPGPVGLRIVVDANLPARELEALVRDIHAAYGAASVLSTHIYDSEEAATYDRHLDGGALAALHLVARTAHDAVLEVDWMQIRGITIEPWRAPPTGRSD